MHVAFSDESNWNRGRYRSIAIVTADVNVARSLHKELSLAFDRSFSFKKCDSSRFFDNALKILDILFKYLGNLRIDVLVWDACDSRHSFQGHDVIENMHYMTRQLYKNTLSRWSHETEWFLYPDQTTFMNWDKIVYKLHAPWHSIDKEFDLLKTKPENKYKICKVEDDCSDEVFCILQIADLFAGLARYSYEQYDNFNKWLKDQEGAQDLFDDNAYTLSNAMKYRYPILQKLLKESRSRKLGISFNKNKGLSTPNPSNPINFWFYHSQGDYDKVAIKKKVS